MATTEKNSPYPLTYLGSQKKGYFGYLEELSVSVGVHRSSASLRGWLFHPKKKISFLKISISGSKAVTVPPMPRPDVQKVYKVFPTALESGFQALLVLDQELGSDISIKIEVFGPKNKLEDSLLISRQAFSFQKSVPSLTTTNALDGKSRFLLAKQESLNCFMSVGESLTFQKSARPKLSIIIVTYNQPHLILKCLQHLLSLQSVASELIIVDNSSDQPTQKLLQKIQGAEIFLNRSNLHFLWASNLGAQKAKGEYLLFLNSDCFVSPGAIESCVKMLESDPKIGAVGPKVLNIDGTVQEAGSVIWKDGSTSPFGHNQPSSAPEIGFSRPVDYVSGAFLMTPRKLFLSQGAFDIQLQPAYYEDTDYCARLNQNGFKVLYNHRAVVTHFLNGSTTRQDAIERIQRNKEIFVCKNLAFLETKFDPQDARSSWAHLAAVSGKKILFLDQKIPNPQLGGGFPRSSVILDLMRRQGHFITTYSLMVESHPTPDPDTDPFIEKIPHAGRSHLLNFLNQRQGFYDAIWISRPETIQFFNQLLPKAKRLLKGVQLIYDSEAVTTPRLLNQLQLNGSPAKLNSERQLSKELKLYSPAHHVVAVSKPDALLLGRANKNVSIFGHHHPLNKLLSKFEETRHFLFIGPLVDEMSPNFDSILWFLEQVWPLIRAKDPNAQLTCLGPIREPQAKALSRPGVRFLGRQADLDAYFRSHRVFIAPTRFAAGLPFKCTEAAAFGIPQVVTPVLQNQLGWSSNQQALVAENATAFADACLKLHSNPVLWRTIQKNSHQFAKKNYDLRQGHLEIKRILGWPEQAAKFNGNY